MKGASSFPEVDKGKGLSPLKGAQQLRKGCEVVDVDGSKAIQKRELRAELIDKLILEFNIEFDGSTPRSVAGGSLESRLKTLLAPYTVIRPLPFVCCIPRIDMQRVVCKWAELDVVEC